MQRKPETVVDLTEDGGIKKTILKEGSGDVIPMGSVAKVHYRGTLDDGTVFDTSRTRGTPFKFNVGKREGNFTYRTVTVTSSSNRNFILLNFHYGTTLLLLIIISFTYSFLLLH